MTTTVTQATQPAFNRFRPLSTALGDRAQTGTTPTMNLDGKLLPGCLAGICVLCLWGTIYPKYAELREEKKRTEKTLNILYTALRYWNEKDPRIGFRQRLDLKDYIQFLETGTVDKFKKKLFKECSKQKHGALTRPFSKCRVGELRGMWLTFEEQTASQTYCLMKMARNIWEDRRVGLYNNDIIYDTDTITKNLNEISRYMACIKEGDYANLKQLLKDDIQHSRGPFIDAITNNQTKENWINYLNTYWKL